MAACLNREPDGRVLTCVSQPVAYSWVQALNGVTEVDLTRLSKIAIQETP